MCPVKAPRGDGVGGGASSANHKLDSSGGLDKAIGREEALRLEFTRLGDDVIEFRGAGPVMEHLFERVGIPAVS